MSLWETANVKRRPPSNTNATINTGLAVSHCIAWFQTWLVLPMCQIRHHGHCGIIVALDSSEP